MAKEKLIKRKGLFLVGFILFCLELIYTMINIKSIYNRSVNAMDIMPLWFTVMGCVQVVACSMMFASIRKSKFVKFLYCYMLIMGVAVSACGLWLLIANPQF